MAKSTVPDSNRLQGNRSGATAASTIGVGDSTPSSSSTSKLGQEDAASAGGKSSHSTLIRSSSTIRTHRSKRDLGAALVLPASGTNPPNPFNVRTSSSSSDVLVRVFDDDDVKDSPESMRDLVGSSTTYQNPINDGGGGSSSFGTGDGINPELLTAVNSEPPELERVGGQLESLLLSSAGTPAEAASDPDAPLNSHLIDLFSHEGLIPVSVSVVRPTKQSSSPGILQLDETSHEPPPSEQHDPEEKMPFYSTPFLSSNHITTDSTVPDYVDDEAAAADRDDNVSSTLPNDPLRANNNPPPTQPDNLLFSNELGSGEQPDKIDPTKSLNFLITGTEPHLRGIGIISSTPVADDDVDYYFDDIRDNTTNKNGVAVKAKLPVTVVNEKESLLMQQHQAKKDKENQDFPKRGKISVVGGHNQQSRPQLATDVNAKAALTPSSTAASAEGGRRKKSANHDSGAMKNEPVKLSAQDDNDASGDGVGSGYYESWSDDDLLRSDDDHQDALMMRYNYDNDRVVAGDNNKRNDDIDIRPLMQEIEEESNYIDNPFRYVVDQPFGEDVSLSVDDYANANNNLHGDVSVTNKELGVEPNNSGDLLLHGSPKAPTIDHNKHNANDSSNDSNAQNDNKAQHQQVSSMPQRILVNVSIATDSGSGTQNHAIYMLHVSLPAGPDLRTFDNYNQSLNPLPIPIHVPSHPDIPTSSPIPVTTPTMPLSPECPPCPCGAASKLNGAIIENVEDNEEGTTITNELTTSSSLEDGQASNSITASTVGLNEDVDQTDRITVGPTIDYDNFESSSTSIPTIGPLQSCRTECPDIPILILEGERVSTQLPHPSLNHIIKSLCRHNLMNGIIIIKHLVMNQKNHYIYPLSALQENI